MMKKLLLCGLSLLVVSVIGFSQANRWQQRAAYQMEVTLDVNTHRLNGSQVLVYENNSDDTLSTIYYHLYFNAFQPGSMMDVRSRSIADPDSRVGSRIAGLTETEIGFQRIKSLTQDGRPLDFVVEGTLLKVPLQKPLLPHTETTLQMEFESQVPVQIRRTGRNNSEGIAYSMTQWYPKLAEYDHQGWHINPYVAREFHGVWGDFDVKITLDGRYTVAGTGVLQNPGEIGHGYADAPGNKKSRAKMLTWHFQASDVHDFAWAADPEYKHLKTTVPGGPEIHFFYQPNEKTQHWEKLPAIAVRLFQFMNEKFGAYPYPSYSVIQGGDGGMEYAMCTLIMGEGSMAGTTSTMIHEVIHSWFQGVLANNEAQYAWMDEGFTRFAEFEAKHAILNLQDPHSSSYKAYAAKALSGKEEPAALFSDFFTMNDGYKIAAYVKGALFLTQIRYMVGEKTFWEGMRAYYETWKFRHPEPQDFIRVMEKRSGMQLKWFLNLWISTTRQIDYAVTTVEGRDQRTEITLARKGEIPMPIDLRIMLKDGTTEQYHIPLNETFGAKPAGDSRQLPTWNWVNESYSFVIDHPVDRVTKVALDPGEEMADVNRSNNIYSSSGHP